MIGTMDELEKLREKLKLVESLFQRPGSVGERSAAEGARARLKERLEQLEAEVEKELYFTFSDRWSRQLFLALLRRHSLHPYRYKGQRYTSVVVRSSPRLMDEVILPEFNALDDILREGLEKITQDLISSIIHSDSSDETEVKAAPQGLPR